MLYFLPKIIGFIADWCWLPLIWPNMFKQTYSEKWAVQNYTNLLISFIFINSNQHNSLHSLLIRVTSTVMLFQFPYCPCFSSVRLQEEVECEAAVLSRRQSPGRALLGRGGRGLLHQHPARGLHRHLQRQPGHHPGQPPPGRVVHHPLQVSWQHQCIIILSIVIPISCPTLCQMDYTDFIRHPPVSLGRHSSEM